MTLRFATRLVTCGALVAATLPFGIPAGPSDALPADPTAPAAPAASEPTGPATSHQVTLITGDVVRVDRIGDRTAVSVSRAGSGSVAYESYTRHGDTYVVPLSAQPYVRSGVVDAELFNVTRLVEQGYGDAASQRLPVIVTYAADTPQAQVRQRADNLPASTRTRTLASVDGAAVDVLKPSATAFWSAVDGARPRVLDRGITGIWLDAKVSVALDESVSLIGAPQAWEAGYDGTGTTVAVLDTGIDTDHPDLADRVVATANFVPGESIEDGFGHGTHVASIIAGSGAASGGRYTGVAPGADLMIGKVLDNNGSGTFSQIIDGLEWAANNGADIVNLSLGCGPRNGCVDNDGTDPASQAINELTESTGTLFVVAAGNDGPGDGTIAQPGVADAALTVGATDNNDEMADFSSRGPRFGDGAVKPDITAPGVAITAARATGTDMGGGAIPVDDDYITASGTSMATPHVAGAAAILQQAHPNWDAEELKAALTSTATDTGHTVHEQGAGRVDIARAHTQQIYATDGPLNFGRLPFPQTELEPRVRTFSLVNDSGADVTLDLTVTAADADGTAAPDGMLTVSQPSVTVPAGGTTTVDVTLDPALGDAGRYSGAVVAQNSDGVQVRLALGFDKEPEVYDLTTRVLDRLGNPSRGATVVISSVDHSRRLWATPTPDASGSVTLRVPPGTYSVLSIVPTVEGGEYTYTFVGDPEVEVGPGGAEVTLDGREAAPVGPVVRRETEAVLTKLEFWRQPLAGDMVHFRYLLGEPFTRIYAAPTERVTKGAFHLVTQFSLAAPDLKMSAKRLPVFQPEYFIYSPELPDGDRRLRVVDVGTGTPAELAAVDTRGKIALIDATDGAWTQRIRDAAADGAVMALLWSRSSFPFFGAAEPGLPIPGAALRAEDAAALRSWLAHDRKDLVDVHSQTNSPFLYDLRYDEDGRVPANLRYKVDERKLARIDTTYHADQAGRMGSDLRASFAPWQENSLDAHRFFELGHARTEYVNARPGLLWLHTVYGYVTPELVPYRPLRGPLRYWNPGDRIRESWLTAPAGPQIRREPTDQNRILIPCSACRDDDELFFWFEHLGDADGHYGAADPQYDTTAVRLYRNGSLVTSRTSPRGAFPATPEAADYRLEIDTASTAPWQSLSSSTHTVWRFRSAAPASEADLPAWYECAQGRGRGCGYVPLLYVDYDLDLDRLNRAPAGRTYRFDVDVDGQPFGPAPRVRWVDVDVSYDDGATWRAAKVRRTGGDWQVTVRHPRSADFVTLRVKAGADGGSSISQEIIRAYRLR